MAFLEWKCTTLYTSDVELLKSPAWFNDNIINFCCDYMQYVLFNDKPYKFVHPGTSFVILHESHDAADLKDTVEGSGINREKSLIFFPVNDSQNLTKPGGSHWSLLVWERKTEMFYVFDSMSVTGNSSAHKLAEKTECKFFWLQQKKISK